MDDTVAVRAFAALAQENRLAIFRHLVAAGPSGLPAGEIAKALGIGPTSLSFHLKELDRAGLVTQTRQGRFIRYALCVEGVRQLIDYLTTDCCGGRPELCGSGFAQAGYFCGKEDVPHE
jgi:DNA-binding transcriptional ArsR family regulator